MAKKQSVKQKCIMYLSIMFPCMKQLHLTSGKLKRVSGTFQEHILCAVYPEDHSYKDKGDIIDKDKDRIKDKDRNKAKAGRETY